MFARRVFRWAAIYGVLVLLPLYALPLSMDRPEFQLGFVGAALVFQGMFWIIGSDPVRFRPFTPIAIAEKLVFAVPALALVASGAIGRSVAIFAAVDLILALLFAMVWRASREAPT